MWHWLRALIDPWRVALCAYRSLVIDDVETVIKLQLLQVLNMCELSLDSCFLVDMEHALAS